VVFPVIGKRLVEGGVFVLRNVLGVTRPDGLGLVELFLFGALKKWAIVKSVWAEAIGHVRVND
jgi:hypothetical protein